MFKYTYIFLFGIVSFIPSYSQSQDSALVYFYRDYEISSTFLVSEIYIDNKLSVALRGGRYDSIYVESGCHKIKMRQDFFKNCFESFDSDNK